MDTETLQALFGKGGDTITWWQMTVRGLICLLYGLALIRFAGHRIFGKATALDVVLSVIVGSNLSRALTGNAALLETLAATTGIVAAHWAFARIAIHWHGFSRLVKGDVVLLANHGRCDHAAMHRHGIGDGDIEEAARNNGLDGLERVDKAYLERNGQISIIPR